MDEEAIMEEMKSQGYQEVYVYQAEPNEVDEEHEHDFDTRLVILDGQIQVIALNNGLIINTSHQRGAHVDIERNTPHSAKVGPEGCRYIVGKKH